MNDYPFANLRSLIEKGAVQQIVDAFGHKGGVSFACLIERDCYEFSSSDERLLSAESRVDIGCLMKNLTSLLVAYSEAEGQLKLEDQVSRFFPEHAEIDLSLRVYHLLNHSHGLDGSMLRDVPLTRNGLIDSESIWKKVRRVQPISRPGSMFYYWGSVGYWIAGAILERVHGCNLTDLIAERILAKLDRRVPSKTSGLVCPASGGIMLSANELLQLCRIHLWHLRSGDSGDSIRRLGSEFNVLVPQWPLAAEGVANGWFIYVGSMLGMSGTEATILVSPRENAAFALTGSELHAARRQLLGTLAVAANTQRPRLLTIEEAGRQRLDVFVGLYRKASLILEIRIDEQGKLQANVYRLHAGGQYQRNPYVSRSLIPCEHNTFFPSAPELSAIPLVRFERPNQKGLFEYADSSMHVFRRIE